MCVARFDLPLVNVKRDFLMGLTIEYSTAYSVVNSTIAACVVTYNPRVVASQSLQRVSMVYSILSYAIYPTVRHNIVFYFVMASKNIY